MVRRSVMRLSAAVDEDTGAVGDPRLLVGAEEYTLHEAEALISALTQLVDEGRGVSARAAR